MPISSTPGMNPSQHVSPQNQQESDHTSESCLKQSTNIKNRTDSGSDSGYDSPLSGRSITPPEEETKTVFTTPSPNACPKNDIDVSDNTETQLKPSQLIGTGRFSRVHASRLLNNAGDNIPCALKIPTQGNEDELNNERSLLQSLPKHPNIVQYYGTREVEHRKALLLEFIDGPSLDTLTSALDSKQLPVKDFFNALRFIEQQKFQALAHLMQHNIVHADLKPSNFMVSMPSCEVKLIDLGRSAYVGEKVACGHEDYTPPEAIDSLQGKQQSDIKASVAIDSYAMGQMLFKLFSGLEDNEGLAFVNQAKLSGFKPSQRVEKAFLIKQALASFTQAKPDGSYQTVLPTTPGAIKEHAFLMESGRSGAHSFDKINDSALVFEQEFTLLTDLINCLMHPIAKKRLNAQAALQHPWFSEQTVDKAQAIKTLTAIQ